jgi:hypothetical protein
VEEAIRVRRVLIDLQGAGWIVAAAQQVIQECEWLGNHLTTPAALQASALAVAAAVDMDDGDNNNEDINDSAT